MDDESWTRPAPRPGDPRSSGPRPRARGRDVAWAALAAALVTVTVWQLGRLLHLAVTDPAVALSSGGLLLAFLITVVWLLTIYWLALGSWRRSVWGCPFTHDAAAPAGVRCPRHRTIPAADEP